MLNRRSFLQRLAALPIVAALIGQSRGAPPAPPPGALPTPSPTCTCLDCSRESVRTKYDDEEIAIDNDPTLRRLRQAIRDKHNGELAYRAKRGEFLRQQENASLRQLDAAISKLDSGVELSREDAIALRGIQWQRLDRPDCAALKNAVRVLL